MGRRKSGDEPVVRITRHGSRRYARLRVAGETHNLGFVDGSELSPEQQKAARLLASKTGSCCVYVIGDGDGNYKIGVASDVESRLKSLQVGNANKLFICHLVRCDDQRHARVCEYYAHKSLEAFHRSGEWFRCSSGIAIDAVVASLGMSVQTEALA